MGIHLYKARVLTLRKNLNVKTQKKDASFCLCSLPWGSYSAFLSPRPFDFQICIGQSAQLQIPQSHVFFKCRSLKGTTANGSVALQGFNHLNEVHSKKCMLGFFSFHSSTSISIFPPLIETNFPCCFVLQNTWMGLLFWKGNYKIRRLTTMRIS